MVVGTSRTVERCLPSPLAFQSFSRNKPFSGPKNIARLNNIPSTFPTSSLQPFPPTLTLCLRLQPPHHYPPTTPPLRPPPLPEMTTFLGEVPIPPLSECPDAVLTILTAAASVHTSPAGADGVPPALLARRRALHDALQGASYEDLTTAVPSGSDAKALYVLALGGFLDPQHALVCKGCSSPLSARLTTSVSTAVKHGVWWRCSAPECGRQASILLDTIIPSSAKLSLSKILRLLYCFTHDWRANATESELRLSKPTVLKWFAIFRGICTAALSHVTIGGDGLIVEVRITSFLRHSHTASTSLFLPPAPALASSLD